MLVVGHELSITVFAFMVLFAVVSLAVLDYLTTRAAGADEHVLLV